MKARPLFSILLSGSLLFSGVPVSAADQAETGTAGTFLTRTFVSEANGLRHYEYTDENGNSVTLDQGKKQTSTRKKASSLPSSYSSIEHGTSTSIKDQGDTGACWAFGAIKALESSAISKNLSSLASTDLSESHLAWYTYTSETDTGSTIYGDMNVAIDSYADVFGQGGDASMAISTLTNWWGAASESDAPFDSSRGGSLNMTNRMQSASSSLRYRSELRLKEANCYDNADISAIKQAVMTYGDVNVSHFYPESRRDASSMVQQTGSEYSMYQSRRSADYANHSVSIVGWDDSYSSFKSSPPSSGAWLIANSWGEDCMYSDNGYYWVSYYDTSLCDYYTFEADTPDRYDTNYQYDGAGYCGAMNYDSDTSAANVFTNHSSSPQEIKAVGMYTLADNQSYEIYLYRHVNGTTPDSGEFVSSAVTSGTAEYEGFHTITLREPVTIAAGETFSVVVNYKLSGKSLYIPLEGDKSSASAQIGRFSTIEYKRFRSSAGQSFLYNEEDGWIDTTSSPSKSNIPFFFSSSSSTNYNNVCLKAFGSTITSAEYNARQSSYVAETRTISDAMAGRASTAVNTPTPIVSTPLPAVTPVVSATAVPAGTPSASPAAGTATAPVTTPFAANTAVPTVTPVARSTEAPTAVPAATATAVPTKAPAASATVTPSIAPTASATIAPSVTPAANPETESADPATEAEPKTVVSITPLITSYTIGKGEQISLSYQLDGKDRVMISSSNDQIAAPKEGDVVVGTGTGTAKIFLRTESGDIATVNVTVKKAPKKITASVAKKTLKKGKKEKIKLTLPSGSASYAIKYTSSNKNVVSVSGKGVIKAKKKGTAKITVKTFNGKKSVIKIKVTR